MTSVEKRRSGRKSGSHRKRRSGGYRDASRGGSFLDETDREVSSLTDRAFRSLCIGEEAVYNDSEPGVSSPSRQRERLLAFGQSVQESEREDLKRSAQENFSLRVQQYEEEYVQGGMYGADINQEPQWEVYGERTEGRVSATFQHSFVETCEQEKPLRHDHLSFFSNGVTEDNTQQFRSRSRVSSLIRAFNSEGCRDLTAVEEKLRECNNETQWDKSALMSIQQELSEFSTPYQHNFTSGHLPISGPFSSQNPNFYSSEMTAMAHMSSNSTTSLMRSSHSKLSMAAQFSHSNFFIHSEFSPFKVWRDHNKFPFKHGHVTGFVPYSEFPKWYETPMYKELSVQSYPHGPCRGINDHHIAAVVPSAPPRSTSASTMLQKASAVEKRCESELACHYQSRNRTQSLGSKRLPSQRPSTASPTSEMSRRVQDTISSVKALQQKIKRMTGQDVNPVMMTNPPMEVYGNNNFPYSNNMVSVAESVVSSNASTNPFNSNQMLMPSATAPQEATTTDLQMQASSPLPVEHPPVRAESRGAMFDVRSSSYKSRASSLLFNLKDNRKRVKNTYSPTKFKLLEAQEKNQRQDLQETVIDIPEITNQDFHYSQQEDWRRSNAHHQYVNNPQPLPVHPALYPEYTPGAYQAAHAPAFSGFTPELIPDYAGSQLTNGQHLHNDFASFAAYEQEQVFNKQFLAANLYGLNPSDTSTDVNLNIGSDQSHRYLPSDSHVQALNQTAGGNRYEQFKHSKPDYGDVASREHTDAQHSAKTHMAAWKPEASASVEKTRQESISSVYKERESQNKSAIGAFCFDNSSQQPGHRNLDTTAENQTYYGKQHLVYPNEKEFQKYSASETTSNSLSHSYGRYSARKQGHENVHCLAADITESEDMGPKMNPDPKGLHVMPAEPQMGKIEPLNVQSQTKPLSAHALTNQRIDRSLVEVRTDHVKAENAQLELPISLQRAEAEQPKTDLNGLIIAETTCSREGRVEQAQAEAKVKENAKTATTEHIENMQRTGEQDDKAASTKAEQVKEKLFQVTTMTDQPNIFAEEAGTVDCGEQHIDLQMVGKESVESVKIKQKDAEQARIKQVTAEEARNGLPWDEPKTLEKDKIDFSKSKQVRTENVDRKSTEMSKKSEQSNIKKAEDQEGLAKEVEMISRDRNRMRDVGQTHQNLVKLDKCVNVEQSASLACIKKETKLEDIKSNMGKFKPTKEEEYIFEIGKAKNLQEKSAQLAAKVTGAQQGKVEPDKVEQVKTELAKAKAELAKIKEKMRGEQRDKPRNTTPKNANSVDSVKVNITTNVVSKNQDQTLQVSQQQERENAVVRNTSVQPDRGADDYDRLREKYGFITSHSNRTKTGPLPTETSLDGTNEIKNTSLDKPGTVNIEKLKEHTSEVTPISPTNKGTESLKASEEVDTQYIYSETSKEFKLWSSSDPPTKEERSSTTEKVNKSVKSEKCDPVKATDVFMHNNENANKLFPMERKPQPNVSPAKDPHFSPLKSLSNKERAQIKQEILTSKIKAHAEKEISAIKEKGFLLRDGSKGSSKALLSIQSANVRQRPPQEVAQKNENIISSNITLKDHKETSSVQLEPITSVLPPCSNMSVKSSEARAEDPLQGKGYDKKPTKNNKDLPELPSKPKPTAATTNTPGSQEENQDNRPEKVLLAQTNEQEVKQEKESSGQTVGCIKKEFENSLEKTRAESAKEKSQSEDVDQEDSGPSLNLVLGQKQSLETVDNVQIMGIMVTVRERNTDEEERSRTQKLENIEPSRSHPDSSQHVKIETALSKETGTTKFKSVHEGGLTEDEKQADVGKKPKTDAAIPSLEMSDNIMPQNVIEKNTEVELECSLSAKPRAESQSELQAEKEVTVTVRAKNKVLDETQHLPYKQSISSSETKKYQQEESKGTKDAIKTGEENFKKNLLVHAEIPKINNEGFAETQKWPEEQTSVKGDLTNDAHQFIVSDKEDISAPLLERQTRKLSSPKLLNPGSLSPSLTAELSNTVENNLGNNDVHIDCISIRVVPMVLNNDILEMKRNQQTVPPTLDAQRSDEQNISASTNCEENKMAAQSGVGEASEPLQTHKVQSRNIAIGENPTVNENSERVNKNQKVGRDVNEHSVEGGYFQIQKISETNDDPQSSQATVEDLVNTREPLKASLHKENTSTKHHKEQIHEAFLFKVEKDKSITVKSSPVSIQDEGGRAGSWEAETTRSTKLNDGTAEGWSNAHGGASHFNVTKKDHVETELTLRGSDKQSSQDSTERRFKEKSDIKTRPKQRTTTIPEISALADYARLKVIVSEDKELNPIQEFPPDKKEGFFPLIQSRYSRRPVFTIDTLEHPVKEKTERNKMQTNAKVNKEPKAIIYPITEKEHQRTGMFKLGDKERLDRIQSSSSALERTVTAGTETQQQVDENQSLQIRTPSSAVTRSRHTLQGVVYMDKTSPQCPTTEETQRGLETTSMFPNSVGQVCKDSQGEAGDRRDKQDSQSLFTRDKEDSAKRQGKLQQLEKEWTISGIESKWEKDPRTNKQTESSLAYSAEVERGVSQIEEGKRAKVEEVKQSPIKADSGAQLQDRIKGRRSDDEIKVTENEKKQRTEEMKASLAKKEEQGRRKAIEEHLKQERTATRRQQEELQRRHKKEDQQRNAAEEEHQGSAAYHRGAFLLEQQRKAAEEEQRRKLVTKKEQSNAAQQELQKRAAQEEQHSVAVHQRGTALIEQQRKAAQEEQQRKAAKEEQQRKAAKEEQQRKAAKEEQQRKAAAKEEQQRKVAKEEKQRRAAAKEEQQRKAAQEEQQRKAVKEEQQRKAAQEEHQRKAAREEQQRKAAQEEEQRKAAREEQQRKAAREEQQRKAAREEQQRIAAQEEQRIIATQEEQRRKAVQEEQQRKAAQEEQQRSALYLGGAALKEQELQRRAAREERSRATHQEQHKNITREEQQRMAASDSHKKDLQKENQVRFAQQEQQKGSSPSEQQAKAAQEQPQEIRDRKRAEEQELQKRAFQEEQHRRDAWEEQRRKVAHEKLPQKSEEKLAQKAALEMKHIHADEKLRSQAGQQRPQRSRGLTEEQRQPDVTDKNRISFIRDMSCEKSQRVEDKVADIRKENISQYIQEKIQTGTQSGDMGKDRQEKEEPMRSQTEAQEKVEQCQESQAGEVTSRDPETGAGALKEEMKETRIDHERLSIQKEDEIRATKTEEEKKTSALTERIQVSPLEKQKRLAQMDALQYYAITSPEPEKKSGERQLFSPLHSQRRHNSSRLGQIEKSNRPQGPVSPAPSLPRSTTSSPVPGVKPLMFRVKDNTFRGSTFTKSVKPRFHKNFGEDFWGSQLDNGSEKGDEEQVKRQNTGTPIHSDTGLLRHTPLHDSSSQGSIPPISYQRPYSRRSIAFDEDDTRSVISTMSEDVESYATSAADLGDIRGLYEYERPESACSFSSDISRASCKPPTVPPKSEKALRRAQRLTTRRIKKELSKVIENNPQGTQSDDSIYPPSTISEVCSSDCDAVASPHFSPPLSLAHAPTLGSSLPSSHTKQQSNKRSFHASPHATAPISLPNSSAHAIAAVSLPVAHKPVAHVPSSSILRHAVHAAPVTQYQVESRYPQSYPLTQRKVLQDLGSGQYFVVDVPVEVKTKTFIDPETGKYVQLNVRESRQSVSKLQQLCPKVTPQTQSQIKKPQQSMPYASKTPAFHHGYQSHSQNRELAAINSISPTSSVHEHSAISDSHGHQHPALQRRQSTDGHRYSPEKTPYMDTVNNIEKHLNPVQDTRVSFPESDFNNQLTGCSEIGNDNSVHSQCLPRDIIAMSELDDFMEVSDW